MVKPIEQIQRTTLIFIFFHEKVAHLFDIILFIHTIWTKISMNNVQIYYEWNILLNLILDLVYVLKAKEIKKNDKILFYIHRGLLNL